MKTKPALLLFIILAMLQLAPLQAQNSAENEKAIKQTSPLDRRGRQVGRERRPIDSDARRERWPDNELLLPGRDSADPSHPLSEKQKRLLERRQRLMERGAFPRSKQPLQLQNPSDDVQEVWVSRYASGLAASSDAATAIAVDGSGNVYVTGLSSSLPFGVDYFTAKYNTAGAAVWTARYNGTGNSDDLAFGIAVDASGNVYVTGRSLGQGTGWDAATIKYNASGAQQWVARYNGPANDYDDADAIAIDGAGNVYVTGESRGAGTSLDYNTIKYNSAGVEQWVARYNGPGNSNDFANALGVDGSGNVYVTGRSESSSTSGDYATIKYNNAGAQQWVARYNGPGNLSDIATALAVDAAGNVYVTGYSQGSGTDNDYATIKYNSAGAQQWVARYNGPGNSFDEATALAVDAAGNVYLTGYSSGSGTSADYATIKYNSAGVEQWVARYDGPENSFYLATDLAVDAAGNVYVTGGNSDYATVKYNSSGAQQWVARYDGPGNSFDVATALAVDAAGNVYVTGQSQGSGTDDDYATVKYNSSGIQQSVARYDGPGTSDDKATALAVDAAGNVYVTGYSLGSGAGFGSDYATVKYNSSGIQQWVARYTSPGFSVAQATALAVDGSGNVYVTGRSLRSFTSYDYATVKYNSSGVEQWVAFYNGPGNSDDQATAVAVDAAGNVYVTGESEGSGTDADYATIKYNGFGATQWVTRYNGPANLFDRAIALAVDAAGNVYVTGESEGSGTDADYATIKYNSAGVQQWVQRYNGPGNSFDEVAALTVDANSNVYVTGLSGGSSQDDDYATIKYNSAGVQQWVARYDGLGSSNNDAANALAVDGAGNVYVTGQSQGSGIVDDYATLKYNSSGVQQWVTRYNGPGNSVDEATALAVDGSGNVYVTGRSEGSGSDYDYATIKYSSAGVEQWVARHDGPGNSTDEAKALAVDAAGNVYVTGESQGVSWNIYTTIKYSQSTTAAPIVTTNPATNVSSTAATLNGTVNPNGLSTDYKFQYGATTNYDRETIPTILLSTGTAAIPVNDAITDLAPNTLYHYRVVASNSAGTSNGADQTFTTTTSGTAPIVTTTAATSVSSTSATLNGTVNPNGLSITVKFQYGTTTSYGSEINATPGSVTGTIAVPVSAALTGLAPETLYHYRVVGVNIAGSTSGTDQTFTTSAANRPPAVANAIRNQTLTVGGASFTLNLNAAPVVFNDPDGDTLSYTASSSATNIATANIAGSVLTVVPVAAGSATITVTANDGRGGTNLTAFGVAVQANQPPAITQITPTTPQPGGQAITVRATITDDRPGTRATLNYRRGGDASFVPTDMDSTYQGTIPASFVTSRGVEYFILATDADNAQTRIPNTPNTSSSISVQLASRELKPAVQPGGSTLNAYRLISMPLLLTDPAATAVLEDDLGPYNDTVWRLFDLIVGQPLSNKTPYVEVSQTGVFVPGKSFFLIVKAASRTIDVDAGRSMETHQEFPITLEIGHNFVATPFNFSIPVSKLRLQNRGPVVLRTYDGSGFVTADGLSPWEGYYLANNSASTDILFVNPNLSSSTNLQAESRTSAGEWRVQILASCGQGRDIENFAGVAASGNEAWDDNDLVEPPPIGEYVSVYFPHPEWQKPLERYSDDMRSASNPNQRWRFVAESNIANEMVTLRFDGVKEIDHNLAIFLVDEALNYKQNLRENAVYQYQPRRREYTKAFTLIVGKENFVSEQTANAQGVPENFVLEQNYPNPFPPPGRGIFDNPETAIRFGLPQQSVVTIKIFNLAGHEVATLLDRVALPAGRHQRVWDGRDAKGRAMPSGVYFYQMRAGNFSRTKKFMLLR